MYSVIAPQLMSGKTVSLLAQLSLPVGLEAPNRPTDPTQGVHKPITGWFATGREKPR
jgi:hypothetical protein